MLTTRPGSLALYAPGKDTLVGFADPDPPETLICAHDRYNCAPPTELAEWRAMCSALSRYSPLATQLGIGMLMVDFPVKKCQRCTQC